MLTVSACSKPAEPPRARSIDYFRAHTDERASTVQQCEHPADGYQARNQEECGTAEAAQAMEERAADARKLAH
ncbi:EexN family lipoprotein [Sphingomonas vulcanisoli]|uniref:EexN family lipoprotein n=1 Tax=Sphingomonas vulcanisoli TaxID=1658060 RepID=UPI0014238A0F